MEPQIGMGAGQAPNMMPPGGMSQGQMPGMPSAMPEQMATPQQRQQLLDIIDATRGKLGELNTAKFSVLNSGKQLKSDTLKEAFTILQQAGVDLTNPESVAQFLAQLKQSNPELFQYFEEAFNDLLGEDQGPVSTPGNMNETLPEDIRGSAETQSEVPLG